MAALPGIHNYSIHQGSRWERVVTYVDEDGNAINLTDYTARMTARLKNDLTFEITTTSGIVIDGLAGKLTLTLDATQTSGLDASSKHVYDLVLIPPSGAANAIVLLTGGIDIRPRVVPGGTP